MKVSHYLLPLMTAASLAAPGCSMAKSVNPQSDVGSLLGDGLRILVDRYLPDRSGGSPENEVVPDPYSVFASRASREINAEKSFFRAWLLYKLSERIADLRSKKKSGEDDRAAEQSVEEVMLAIEAYDRDRGMAPATPVSVD